MHDDEEDMMEGESQLTPRDESWVYQSVSGRSDKTLPKDQALVDNFLKKYDKDEIGSQSARQGLQKPSSKKVPTFKSNTEHGAYKRLLRWMKEQCLSTEEVQSSFLL